MPCLSNVMSTSMVDFGALVAASLGISGANWSNKSLVSSLESHVAFIESGKLVESSMTLTCSFDLMPSVKALATNSFFLTSPSPSASPTSN